MCFFFKLSNLDLVLGPGSEFVSHLTRKTRYSDVGLHLRCHKFFFTFLPLRLYNIVTTHTHTPHEDMSTCKFCQSSIPAAFFELRNHGRDPFCPSLGLFGRRCRNGRQEGPGCKQKLLYAVYMCTSTILMHGTRPAGVKRLGAEELARPAIGEMHASDDAFLAPICLQEEWRARVLVRFGTFVKDAVSKQVVENDATRKAQTYYYYYYYYYYYDYYYDYYYYYYYDYYDYYDYDYYYYYYNYNMCIRHVALHYNDLQAPPLSQQKK